MRGKKAKLFRRYSERHTVGQPNVEYREIGKGQRVLASRCTRAAYLRLKDPSKWRREEIRNA